MAVWVIGHEVEADRGSNEAVRSFVAGAAGRRGAAMDVDATGKGHGYIGTHSLPSRHRPPIIGDGEEEGAVADKR